MSHTCHADGCHAAVPPKLFMCLKHWRMVPRDMQRAIWRHYRPGQEIDKQPSTTYVQVAKAAIEAVSAIEATRRSPQQTIPGL